MKNSIYRQSGNIKRLLFVIAIILIFLLLQYSQRIVEQLREDSTNLVRFYADVYTKAATDKSSQDFSFIFDQIIKRISIPIIISAERDSIPTAWKGVNIDTSDFSQSTMSEVEIIMKKMDKENEPIALKWDEYTLGYVHYGDTQLIQRLRMLPYVEIAVVGLFIFLGYLGFQIIRSSEKHSIWVGMAKETAHQLGTPISSLMGWIEVMKSEIKSSETIDDMSKDLERLERITSRFSQIGSTPAFHLKSLNDIINEVVNYFNRRLPQLSPEVALRFEAGDDYKVMINPDLFSWSLENLIKNALDAVPSEYGKVEVFISLLKHDKYVAIDVVDNGKGISKTNRRNVFRPGYSTKQRGWGLGLSLARRIIEEYHHGDLMVKESKPGERTVMRIVLKKGEVR